MCEKEWKHFLSTEIFFFFYKSKKTFFSLENLPQIWGFVIVHLFFLFFFSGHKKRKKIWRILNTSEDFFPHTWSWVKKIYISGEIFFPLHALNWNFMFEMKWKKVSHKKKKTFSHFRKKKLLCRQKSHGYGFQTWENNPTVWQNTWLCSLRVDPLTSCPVGLLSERPLSCGFGTRRDGRLQSPAGRRHRTGFHADPWEKEKNINSLIINTPVCTFL